MKKKIQVIPLFLLLMCVFILGACQTGAESPVEESAETTAEEQPAESPTEAAPTTSDEAASAEVEVIKVGAAHALSGPIALYGEPISQGIQLAVAQMNAQNYLGDGKQIEVIYEDTNGDKEQAISVFEKLINQDEVVAILGPTLSNSAFAADPIAQEAGVPVIGSSNTATGITEMGDFVFRTSLPESAVIPNTLQVVAAARGMQDVAVMYGNDDQFTQSGYDVFAATLEDLGTNVVTTETFAKGDADFNAQLTKIKSLAPQGIIASALAEEAANIMSQARQQGIEAYFIGGNGFNSPKLAEIAGDAAEGAISGAAWFIGNPTPENQTFVEAYRAEFGADPDQFAAQAYTAAWVLGAAIKNADSTDRTAIRDALAVLQNLATPLGEFSFDANRDPLHTPVVLIVKDGQFALFEE